MQKLHWQSSKVAGVASLAKVDSDDFPDEYRSNPNRTPDHQLKAVRAHATGRSPGRGGPLSSHLSLGALLPFSARASVGDADSRIDLFADGECQHQWRWAQLHSQSVLPFETVEPPVWSYSIDSVLFLANNV